jgi:surface antigen
MTRFGHFASCAVVALGLAGCGADGSISNQTIGLVVGTMAGAAAVGVGAKLDSADKEIVQRKTQEILEGERSGVPHSWRNPDSGNHGAITADQAYVDPNGRNCRPFSQAAKVPRRVVPRAAMPTALGASSATDARTAPGCPAGGVG